MNEFHNMQRKNDEWIIQHGQNNNKKKSILSKHNLISAI